MNMRRVILAAMLLGIFSLVYGQESATVPTKPAVRRGSISGVVTDSQSKLPVQDARVELAREGFSLGISAKTDKEGKFVLGNVPANVFDLLATKENYLPQTIAGIKVKAGEVTSEINVAMKPIGPGQVGEEARDFTVATADGKAFNLASFKGKKAVVLGIGNPYT